MLNFVQIKLGNYSAGARGARDAGNGGSAQGGRGIRRDTVAWRGGSDTAIVTAAGSSSTAQVTLPPRASSKPWPLTHRRG